MGEDIQCGNDPRNNREVGSASGWVTTKQAARSLGISPRTIRWHIEHGNLEAKPEGEGVKRAWLVSIDSLQAFRDSRQVPRGIRGPEADTVVTADIPGNPIRELADRLAEEAARAAEYRVRLEITEKAQSTLEAQLSEEIRRREEAESRAAELEMQLEARQEPSQRPPESSESAAPRSDRVETSEEPSEARRPPERRSLWRRIFGS